MDLTDAIGDHSNDVGYLHDCIYAPATRTKDIDPYEVISYCFTEVSTKWTIQNMSADQIFTFAQLDKQHITSEQLYQWSAPIDIIERYQLYLNQRLPARDVSGLEQQFYYNCTLPRFGPLCQYSLAIYEPDQPSLNAMIYDFYRKDYYPKELTCYVLLECNYGTTGGCLDWADVCDGYIDCEGGIDEALCWELKKNQCEENERRCVNGQCVPTVFWYDDSNIPECLDRSDTSLSQISYYQEDTRPVGEPTMKREDIICARSELAYRSSSSSCVQRRYTLLQELVFFERPSLVSEKCWLGVTCNFQPSFVPDRRCRDLCSDWSCGNVIVQDCPRMWRVPSGTLAFGHMFFLYMREDFHLFNVAPPAPRYICYNEQFCDGLVPNKSLISFGNATCRQPKDFPFEFPYPDFSSQWYDLYFMSLYETLDQCNKINSITPFYCDPFTAYQCINSSKCISKNNICDRFNDCDHGDDEVCIPVNNSCDLYHLTNLFHCNMSNKCLSLSLVENRFCDCEKTAYGFCEDEKFQIQMVRKRIVFSLICDGYIDLIPVLIDGRNETDETECEYWPCNNMYTRCDGFWNCFDGADEINCDVPSFSITCPQHHHLCVSVHTNNFTCLPMEKAGDGVLDCLGGIDEPDLCHVDDYENTYDSFYCNYSDQCVPGWILCSGGICEDSQDEQFCSQEYHLGVTFHMCHEVYERIRSDIENFFCARLINRKRLQRTHFVLDYSTNSTREKTTRNTTAIVLHSSMKQTSNDKYQQTCHRGLVDNLWVNTTKIVCMCPSSYYGDRCQYQNQRVSLTIKLKTLPAYQRTPFILLITLIDDSYQRTIHSYRQLNYLYIRDCDRKFNMNLLYSTRRKDSTRKYFIHIDVYEQFSLKYRESLLIPIEFIFLPVQRVALYLHIIRSSPKGENCSNQLCHHGQCMNYADNADELAFCHCNEGWSGKYCDLQHRCTCSSDSTCVGVSANNRSICICPLNKWGPQCLLSNSVCQSDQNDICHRRGRCVPNDQSSESFTCICQRGFSGKQCEIDDNQFILSFHKDIDIPQIMLVHFIQVIGHLQPEIGTTFKTVLTDQRTISITWSHPWHVALLDFFQQNYYLITIQHAYNRSFHIIRTISPSDRCPHVRELLNQTLFHSHLLRRIKYYHLICQNSSLHLSCFYDEVHLCLCQNDGRQRLANCLEFNHTVQRDCFGQSYCENGAQCLQDRLTCPHVSICVCPKCFYGIQCQFSSSVFDLSLDGILGYHIRPHASIAQQSALVKVSIGLTMIILIGGLINGYLSAITFFNNDSRKTGSGIYLLISSLNTIFTMVVFALKFWILINVQISYVTNRSFLYAQCLSLDYLVKVGVSLDQWLSACVSAERAIATIRGSKFNKTASKQTAKYVIIAVIMIIISTMIQDPIYRRLLDENDDNVDEKRIWCIVRYTSIVQRYNSVILMLHFIAPIAINIIATIIIIINTARQRMAVQTNQTYREVLREQVRRLSHLLVAPLVFIALTIPRLIISFTSGCMKSGGAAWLFLIGYLISFVPLIFTFVVFVYRSKTYKHIFNKTIQRYRRRGLILLNRNA